MFHATAPRDVTAFWNEFESGQKHKDPLHIRFRFALYKWHFRKLSYCLRAEQLNMWRTTAAQDGLMLHSRSMEKKSQMLGFRCLGTLRSSSAFPQQWQVKTLDILNMTRKKVLLMKCKPRGLKMTCKNDLYLHLENNFSIKFVHIVVL